MKKTLLVYPQLGSDDVFIKDVPLSLVYLASDSVKAGYNVEILDLRLCNDWRSALKDHLNDDVLLTGISVLTGNPIRNAIEITKFIKENCSSRIIWGGHHPTMEAESTMGFDQIDFVIRGFGSKPLSLLLEEMMNDSPDYASVPGLSYRENGRNVHNEMSSAWEMISYRDIPYHLIEKVYDQYNRFSQNERIMPIFTSMGCPYNCAFCMAPVLYEKKEKKWVTFEIEEVIAHIKHLIDRYNITYLSVYDDDSFIDIGRMRRILERIVEEGISVKIDFRGARIDELDRMDDGYFELMQRAGVKHFQVGLESGSQNVLDIMNKKINLGQIIRVNRRLSRYDLTPIYNLMTGVPGETINDVKATKNLVMKLYEENERCIIGYPAKFKPLPGTKLYYVAIENGFKPVNTLEGWIDIDTADADMFYPWYTEQYNDYIKMFQITSFFMDRKIQREIQATTWFNRLLRIIATTYRPIAIFRLKYDIVFCNVEYRLYRVFRMFLKLKSFCRR